MAISYGDFQSIVSEEAARNMQTMEEFKTWLESHDIDLKVGQALIGASLALMQDHIDEPETQEEVDAMVQLVIAVVIVNMTLGFKMGRLGNTQVSDMPDIGNVLPEDFEETS